MGQCKICKKSDWLLIVCTGEWVSYKSDDTLVQGQTNTYLIFMIPFQNWNIPEIFQRIKKNYFTKINKNFGGKFQHLKK